MRALHRAFSSRPGYERAQRLARSLSRPLARDGRITRAPGPLAGWTSSRDLPAPAKESFREWWRRNRTPETVSVTLTSHSAANVTLGGSSVAAREPETRRPPPANDARAAVLARITAALDGAQPPPEPPRAYRSTDDRERSETVDLFAERVAEYNATVRRVAEAGIAAAVAEICDAEGARRLGVPPDLPAAWRPETIELVEDGALTPRDLDGLDGALTGCAVAIAETGTFVLDGGPAQGRRALTLVPDLYVCVVLGEQVVGIVPEAVARLEPAVRARRAVTFVSGPSATSDIELDRVEGVHGPRVLHVLVVD
jgi:L-lactate dehydrogenase complex protein LldG